MTRRTESAANLWFANPGMAALLADLRRVLRGCETILDVGCGWASPLRYLCDGRLTGLDGYAPSLEKAKELRTHDEFLLGDVREVGGQLAARKFDAVVAMDVIEHLTKPDGHKMLAGMESLATKCVVIFTPNGFVPQHSHDGDLQEHLSGWDPAEMRQAGYEVCGMHGPKGLRGEKAALKYWPRPFWSLVSIAAHYTYTRSCPEKAFSIFCVKRF